jgi:hypothetical protein
MTSTGINSAFYALTLNSPTQLGSTIGYQHNDDQSTTGNTTGFRTNISKSAGTNTGFAGVVNGGTLMYGGNIVLSGNSSTNEGIGQIITINGTPTVSYGIYINTPARASVDCPF